jgi:hypothetical protein
MGAVKVMGWHSRFEKVSGVSHMVFGFLIFFVLNLINSMYPFRTAISEKHHQGSDRRSCDPTVPWEFGRLG